MPRRSGAQRAALLGLLGVVGGVVHYVGTQGDLPDPLQEQLHAWAPSTYPRNATTASTGRTGRSAGSSSGDGTGVSDPQATVDLGPYGARGFVWDHGVVYTIMEGFVIGNAGSPEEAAQLAAEWYEAWFGPGDFDVGAVVGSVVA